MRRFLTLFLILIPSFLLFSQSIETLKIETQNFSSSSLDRFIEKKKNQNKKNETGYPILICTNNEDAAVNKYHQFKEDFPHLNVSLKYIRPDWKVLTKAYPTKMEAEKVYLSIISLYPNAKIMM